MRSWRPELLAAHVAVLGISFPCLAQNPSGTRTLENLAYSGEAQNATASESEASAATAKRPAGTIARPEEGVKHPDLDKAWSEYDAVVANAAEEIKAAILKQFDAATAKGDLDAAEKWQAAQDDFERDGEVPFTPETKVAVSAAVAEYKRAKENLSAAYDAVVKALTTEKKIAEARAAREEQRLLEGKLTSDSNPRSDSTGQVANSTKTTPRGRPQSARDRIVANVVGVWRHQNGNLEEIRRDGAYIVNNNPRNGYSGTWTLDVGDPKGPCVVRRNNGGGTDRWYVNPAAKNELVHETGVKMRRE
jgi:hypothetical protein